MDVKEEIGLIIDRNGRPVDSYNLDYGIVVHDGKYSICLDYENEEDVPRKREIAKLKGELFAGDYKTIKHMEGLISDEEFETIKAERQAKRDRINELQSLITDPTISREEMDKIEKIAELTYELSDVNGDLNVLWNEMELKIMSTPDANERMSIEKEYRNNEKVVELTKRYRQLDKELREVKAT